METVLFTDHGLVVFVIITSALALTFSVLGLSTTRETRTDIEHQFKVLERQHGYESIMRMPSVSTADEWRLVRAQFEALVRERPDNVEDLLDAEVRKRFGQFMTRAAEREKRSKRGAKTFYFSESQ